MPSFEAPHHAKAGASVELDGTGVSDPDGDAITFHWSFDHVPEDSLLTATQIADNDTRTTIASFVADKLGTYVVALRASDDRGGTSAQSFATIEVLEDALPPVADAGADQTGVVGGEFALGGGVAVDDLGRALTFEWDLRMAPAGSKATLMNADGVAPSFVADLPGLYEVALVVDNGASRSPPDVADVLVSDPVDDAPVAVIEEDGITVEDCSDIGLHGDTSYDPDGNMLAYFWAVQSRPDSSTAELLSDVGSPNATFHPDTSGTYVLSLSVFDGTQWSLTGAMLQAIERPTNTPPAISAGADKSLEAGMVECEELPGGHWDCDACPDLETTVGASASIADADGDDVSMTWRVVSGEADITTDVHQKSIKATLAGFAPHAPACDTVDYELELEGTDCTGATVSDTVVHTVVCCGVPK